MTAMQIAGETVQLNNKGHLIDFDAWTHDVGMALAKGEGLELTECHWSVIDYLRQYYSVHEIPPSPRLIIKEIGEHLTESGASCTRNDLKTLFPDGGCKQACRIAGLPVYYCHAC